MNFLKKYHTAQTFFVFGPDVIAEFDWLRKDIRSLTPAEVVTGLGAVLNEEGIEVPLRLLSLEQLQQLSGQTDLRIVMPDEDMTRTTAERYFASAEVMFDTVFLRWEKNNTLQEQELQPDETLALDDFHHRMMSYASALKEQSADWWRQVGAVIVKEGEILLAAHNQHVPDQYQPLFQGDPRGNFKKGQYIELTTAMHAEAAVIAEAAKRGESLDGAEIYVTTFPCPNCAKLIAYSGIQKVYFQDGYSMVDGESILKENGVEIVKVG
jgi:dCMP deaminase